jgi:hypothetical protein
MTSSASNEAQEVARAWAAEESLLSDDVRHDVHALERLLSAEFFEIGQSGMHWTRQQAIDALLAAPASDHNHWMIGERRADDLGHGLLLLTYRLEYGGRSSRRSSVWKIGGDAVQLVFHQGTPIA